ncbi:MAG TPA: adenine deaminase, partial [Anaerolineae bacterium]|nr:adenine deaminase [Anaerolineae bacterium]
MTLETLIAVARGDQPADLLLQNARLVNVLSGEIHPADIAIHDGWVVGWGDYRAQREVDLGGRYVCPGLIDAHMHLESSMVQPAEFARAVVPHGTTAVICDPHEIANVLGLDGVRYILAASEGLPLRVYVMAPSCVPATHMETAGAELTA